VPVPSQCRRTVDVDGINDRLEEKFHVNLGDPDKVYISSTRGSSAGHGRISRIGWHLTQKTRSAVIAIETKLSA